MFRRIERRHFGSFDWYLLLTTTLLCAVGILGVYSAGFDAVGQESPSARRQCIAMAIGFAAYFCGVFFTTTFWKRISLFLYVLSLVLLALIPFVGVIAGGARSWFDFQGFRMQPSEFSKLALILFLARILASENAPTDGYTLPKLIVPGLLVILPVGLIMLQPDLGTALSVVLVTGSMFVVAGIRGKTLLRIAVIGIVLAIPAWQSLHPYQKDRVLNLYAPERDPQGSGYNALQSKIAVGSGALGGKGFLKGTQTQLRFLPEQTTDFIFSVLAEEWGFVGSIAILGLYGYLLYRIFRLAMKSSDRFTTFVCVGVGALVFWHVFINIGMVIGVLPVVGLTLPLLSYGGSSLVTVMASLGIVSGFSIRRFMFA